MVRSIAAAEDDFIGIVAHELRNPITTLSLYAQLLEERLKLSRDRANLRMVRDLSNESVRLTHLVDDLLTMDTIRAGELTLDSVPFDLGKIAAHVIKNLRGFSRSHKLVLKNELRRKVVGDPDRISQIFINLIENAIKYCRDGTITVSLQEYGKRAIASVSDEGPGIAKKDQKNIFRLRYRLSGKHKRTKGLGLGLYICSAIVRSHGEKIWVESKEGRGAAFYFTLPLAK